MRATLLAVVVAVLSSGCSVVRMHRLRPDWPEDQGKVKRIQLVVQPLPAGNEKVGALFAKVARRYVLMKRDFLVMGSTVTAEAPVMGQLCGEGLDGALWLKPTVLAQGDGFEASVELRLFRCRDGAEVWGSDAGGSFPAQDKGLVEVAKNYAQELGPEVERYVPLAMNLLRPPLDTLPQPKLTEADIEEKMSLDE